MAVLSVLDLSPVPEGRTASDALRNSLDLAQNAERLGYRRYWLAEHHNMPGIASAATAVVIAHVAGGTERIRVGSGGVMLPNHAPLVIAEQFGTLEALFPGRIDLGIGRAPGTDPMTSHALRRSLQGDVDDFPQDVQELLHHLSEPQPQQAVVAVPGAGSRVPVWILGSSLYGAQMAAAYGLPYGFASHFAPAAMMQALEIYRERFEPSEYLSEPYVLLGFNVCAADSQEEAEVLRTSGLQAILRLRSGRPSKLPPPVPGFEKTLTATDQAVVNSFSVCSAVGDLEMVRIGLQSFAEVTGADEIIISSQIYDHGARVRSYEIAAEAMPSALGATG